jgi:hypothetical protein
MGVSSLLPGGIATADWLEKNLKKYVDKFWQGKSNAAEADITEAFVKVCNAVYCGDIMRPNVTLDSCPENMCSHIWQNSQHHIPAGVIVLDACMCPVHKSAAFQAPSLSQADEKLLQPKSGFFGGMGERGVGGSKCGSTAAVAIAFRDGSGPIKLLAANIGDARVLLSRKGKALQLTTDHIPDRQAILQQSP